MKNLIKNELIPNLRGALLLTLPIQAILFIWFGIFFFKLMISTIIIICSLALIEKIL